MAIVFVLPSLWVTIAYENMAPTFLPPLSTNNFQWMLSKSLLISVLGSNLSGATCHFLPRFSIIVHAIGPILDCKCPESRNPVWLIMKPPKASNTGWVLNPWRMCAFSSRSMRNVTEMLLFIAWQSSSSKLGLMLINRNPYTFCQAFSTWPWTPSVSFVFQRG